MPAFTSRFNVGDTVYRIKNEITICDATTDEADLFATLVDSIRKYVILGVKFNADGVLYEVEDRSEHIIYLRQELFFATEREAYLKLLSTLREDLSSHLDVANALFAKSQTSKDFGKYRRMLYDERGY